MPLDPAPLASWARAALAVTYACLAVAGAVYARVQNRPGRTPIGGAISRPKTLWLLYTLACWFTLCPLVALGSDAAPALRWVLGAFAAWMWLRGLAEMVMLFGTRNWSPTIGFTHDLTCLALVAGGLAWHRDAVLALRAPFDLWTLGLVASVLLSLSLECYYARAFHAIVRERTKGDDAVWFASDEDPVFRRINRVTAAGNTVLYSFLAPYVAACFGWL